MRARYFLVVFSLIMNLLVVLLSLADTVVLKNGDRISGRDCSMRAQRVSLVTDYSQKVEIDFGAVEKIVFEQPARIILVDGSEKKAKELSSESFAFRQINAINPPEPKVWSLDASAGYALSRGNSDTQDINVQVTMVKFKEDLYRFTGQGEYAWGEVEDRDREEDKKVVDRGAASLQADLFVIKSCYLYGRSEISYDKIKELDRRIESGSGLGYEIIRHEDGFLDVEFGASYIDSKYTDNTKNCGVYLRWAENGELKLNDRVSLVESVAYQPKMKEFDDYLLNGEIGVRVYLNSRLYLRLTVADRYDSSPPAGTKRNDVYLISSLGVSL